jgi:hypothetical protein
MLHSRPNASKEMGMVVQLGYEPTNADRRAKAFDSIAISAAPIDELLPREGKEAPETRELLQEAVQEGAVLIMFQAKRVVYIDIENEDGVKVRKRDFVGNCSTHFATVVGVVARESLMFSQKRHDHLSEEIIKLIRPSRN